jgi:hypothetical protein
MALQKRDRGQECLALRTICACGAGSAGSLCWFAIRMRQSRLRPDCLPARGRPANATGVGAEVRGIGVGAVARADEGQPRTGLLHPRNAEVRSLAGAAYDLKHSRATGRRTKRPRGRGDRNRREPVALRQSRLGSE